jgi:hypothetical protein
MKDLEKLLREDAARQRREGDPGADFWEKLPGGTWRAYQEDRARRERRWRWLFRALGPAVGALALATAIFVVLHGRRVDPHLPVAVGFPSVAITAEPPSLEEAAFDLDDHALDRLAEELDVTALDADGHADVLERWDVPVDALIDQLTEPQLAELARHLGKS